MHDCAPPDVAHHLTGLEMARCRYLRELARAARAGDPAELTANAAATARVALQLIALHSEIAYAR